MGQGRCYIKAVSHFPEKGGDADAEETGTYGTAVSGVYSGDAVRTDHKSALAARKPPGRLA